MSLQDFEINLTPWTHWHHNNFFEYKRFAYPPYITLETTGRTLPNPSVKHLKWFCIGLWNLTKSRCQNSCKWQTTKKAKLWTHVTTPHEKRYQYGNARSGFLLHGSWTQMSKGLNGCNWWPIKRHLNGLLVHSEDVSKGSITPNWVPSGKCLQCYMAERWKAGCQCKHQYRGPGLEWLEQVRVQQAMLPRRP
jgi:hypothetical protein